MCAALSDSFERMGQGIRRGKGKKTIRKGRRECDDDGEFSKGKKKSTLKWPSRLRISATAGKTMPPPGMPSACRDFKGGARS